MFTSNWCSNIAFIGLISVGLLGLVGRPFAQTPGDAGVAEIGPTIKGNGSSQTDDASKAPEEFSIPIWDFENANDVEHTKEREEKSDQHDAADLKAQQDAASAAIRSAEAGKGQESAAWAQFYLTLVGTVVVAGSFWLTRSALLETRRSNNTARRAVYNAQISSEKELRAYINLKSAHLMLGRIEAHDRNIVLDLILENFGATPADRVRIGATCQIAGIDTPIRIDQDFGSVGPTAEIKIRRNWQIPNTLVKQLVIEAPRQIAITGQVAYWTVFQRPHDAHRTTNIDIVNGPDIRRNLAEGDNTLIGFHLVASEQGNNAST